MPSIDTLIEDIYGIFDKEEHAVCEENLDNFANNLKDVIRSRLNKSKDDLGSAEDKHKKSLVRMSKLGVKDRKLWYEFNDPEEYGSDITGSTHIKFMYGDLLEELLLFYAKEAGHTVEGEQGELDIDGVKGHRDCIIDGITTDVKTASNSAFQKFSKGKLFENDPFGYITQISCYAYADKSPYGAFLAINKESGELSVLKVQPIDMVDPPSRIARVREIETMSSPPEEKCYPDKPQNKKNPTGNRILDSNCRYCRFKEQCWSDANNGNGLRKFKYSNKIEYFTSVLNTPRVDEILDE